MVERDSEREHQHGGAGEGGAQYGAPSQDAGIITRVEGRLLTAEPPRHPEKNTS